MIEIRPLLLDEIPIVQNIARTTWPVTFGDVMPPEQIEYMLNLMYSEESLLSQILDKKHNFLLASEKNVPLGFTSYETNYANKRQIMIHKIYLLPQAQGKGIGTKLIDFISTIGKSIQDTHVRLKVFVHNPNAIGFYEKIGFSKAGIENTDIGNNYIISDYIMLRKI